MQENNRKHTASLDGIVDRMLEDPERAVIASAAIAGIVDGWLQPGDESRLSDTLTATQAERVLRELCPTDEAWQAALQFGRTIVDDLTAQRW